MRRVYALEIVAVIEIARQAATKPISVPQQIDSQSCLYRVILNLLNSNCCLVIKVLPGHLTRNLQHVTVSLPVDFDSILEMATARLIREEVINLYFKSASPVFCQLREVKITDLSEAKSSGFRHEEVE